MICNISLHSQIKMSNLLYNLDCTIWLSMNFFLHLLSAPNSPKTKSGANGKFLPKPLLFHLQLPNSKTNESKFWQIFVRIEAPRTARILGGQNPERKTPFPFSKEISPPPNQKCKECFFFR